MIVSFEPDGRASVDFESEEELDAEYESNLKARGLSLATKTRVPVFTKLNLTLRLAGGGQTQIPATVVALLDGALALSLSAEPAAILTALKTRPPEGKDEQPGTEASVWDRIRALSHTEKMLLVPKADRQERAILLQDNDPQVLFFLLKNPRITVDEVVRVAKSSFLSYQAADLIAKTPQWAGTPDVKIALVANPRTPTPLALRLLPTLPGSEIKAIAKGAAVSQALKQAALRLVIAM